MSKWEKMDTCPEDGKPILIQAKWQYVNGDGIRRWSPWYVLVATNLMGTLSLFPERGMAHEMPIKVRRWLPLPKAPPMPNIDQFKMKVGRAEAAARREHERRISLGMKDD